MASPVEIFCCYAREDQQLLIDLKTHLMPLQRQGLITLWADSEINAGSEWEKEIEKHLDTAQIILLLVSPGFMNSDYCYSKEMTRAMERHEQGEARVIPIIVRPVNEWQKAPFGKLQALPTNGEPVTSHSWYDRDTAFVNVTGGIRKVVEEMSKRRLHDSPAPSTNEQGKRPSFPSRKHRVSNEVKVALFGATALVIAAILTGIFQLRNPGPVFTTTPTAQGNGLLYQVNSQQEWQAWLAPPQSSPYQWKISGDTLVSDGGSLCCSSPDGIIFSPYEPPRNDYAIEAQIQGLDLGKNQSFTETQCCNFGFVVRGSQGITSHRYVIAVRLSPENTLFVNEDVGAVGPGLRGGYKEIIATSDNIQLNKGLHTYRVEVQGNIIRLKIDGRTLISVPDPTFPEGTTVGLFDSGCQLQVKSFAVYLLKS